MLKSYLRPLMAAIFVAMLLLGVTQPAIAHPHVSEPTCEGIVFAGGDCDGHDHAEDNVSGLVSTIIDVLSIIVGAVSVIMIIIGGLRYITSGGESSAVASAKNTILYSIVGLVVVIFAQTIVKFVVGRIAGETEG